MSFEIFFSTLFKIAVGGGMCIVYSEAAIAYWMAFMDLSVTQSVGLVCFVTNSFNCFIFYVGGSQKARRIIWGKIKYIPTLIIDLLPMKIRVRIDESLNSTWRVVQQIGAALKMLIQKIPKPKSNKALAISSPWIVLCFALLPTELLGTFLHAPTLAAVVASKSIKLLVCYTIGNTLRLIGMAGVIQHVFFS